MKKSDTFLNNIHPGPFDPYMHMYESHLSRHTSEPMKKLSRTLLHFAVRQQLHSTELVCPISNCSLQSAYLKIPLMGDNNYLD